MRFVGGIVLATCAACLAGCGTPRRTGPSVSGRQTGPRVAAAKSRPVETPQLPVRAGMRRIEKACDELAGQLAGKLPKDASVAVLPFTDSAGGVRRLGVIASQMLQKELLGRKVRLVDRNDLNNVLAEVDLGRAVTGEGKSLKEVGRIASAGVLVSGQVSFSGRTLLVWGKAVTVPGGRVLASTDHLSVSAGRLDHLLWYVRRPDRKGDLPRLAIRYEFFTQTGGRRAPLGDGDSVRSDQRFKIRLQPNSDCYLYVLLYDSRGRASVLFPHRKIGVSNEARGGVSYDIPEGTKWYWFDSNPGMEVFYIVASYTPLGDLDAIVARMERAGEQRVALARAARKEIDTVITRGMSAVGSKGFRPREFGISNRGVGGIVDIGWGGVNKANIEKIDNVVTGYATVVKKIIFQHR